MAGIEDLNPAELKAFQLGRELMKNPEIHREGLRLAKKANPDLRFVEIELEDQIAASDARAREREQKLADELMAERVARRKGERDKQITDAGFTVEEIEAIIVAEKCSYETAMKLARAERQSADPTAADARGGTHQGAPIEIRGDADFRKAGSFGLGALRKLSAKVAGDMINEFRGTRANTR
jgi:hypothetical protein